MCAKRTSAAFHSPAPGRTLRTRKRQKTSTTPSHRIARDLDSDGNDANAGYETESDYEDQAEQDRQGPSRGSSGADFRRRRSAPTAGGSRSTSTRRGSLPQRQSLGGTAAGPSRGRATRRTGKEDERLAVTQQSRKRTGGKQPLSPLPVNRTVARSCEDSDKGKGKGKGKEREIDPPLQPTRARSTSQTARVTRRSTGSLGEPSTSAAAIRFEEPAVPEGDEEMVDEEELQDGEQEALLDEEEEVEDNSARRLRQSRSRRRSREDLTDVGETADGEGGVDEWEDESTPEQEDLEIEVSSNVEAKLQLWTSTQLHRLKVSELTELYLVTSAGPAPAKKDDLVSAIMSARSEPNSESSLTSVSESDADGGASPPPITSRESSPGDGVVQENEGRKSRSGAGAENSGGGKTPRKKVVVNRKSGIRGPPTPPPSDDGDNDGEDEEAGEATETEEQDDVAGDLAGGACMGRRASQVEMPPPPIPARRHVRTRSSSAHNLSSLAESSSAAAARTLPTPTLTMNGISKKAASPKAKAKVQFNPDVEDELNASRGGSKLLFTSPVAHRTRSQPPSKGSAPDPDANVASTDGKLPRAPSRTKVLRSDKGKGRAAEAEEDEDEDQEMGDDELVLSSDSASSDDPFAHASSVENANAKPRRRSGGGAGAKKPAAPHAVGRRRSARTAKQVETPPSDADEESGGETGRDEGEQDQAMEQEGESDEEIVEEETTRSHLRGAEKGRKVVRLKVRTEDEDEVMADDLEEEDDAGEGDETFRADEDEEDDDHAIDLAHESEKTLLRYKKDELLRLCVEHDLATDGVTTTKKQLVDALLQWREQYDASSPMSGHSSSSSTLSNLSTQTAREETKTQALKAAEHASARTSTGTPLLMRPEHPISPEKPRTPEHSKEREHQEDVNALDLESLQLQDKEIQPEKLEKLERVGSGGFKDVYKGMYRGRTIAICDIRGHLTDMDIKELGLLRDLRHRNIVHFIGVSIPKQPSSVPVMIITELCANGDLFDYIRKTDPPPFTSMLEIALGISRGIDYLHTRKPTIIHRDIKSSNVLITQNGVAKIADFGLARIKTSTKSMIRSLVGTVNWQAPELWSPHPRYNEKVDVYSVGLVFWEILQWHQPVKRYPFEGQNEHAIYHDVGGKQIRPPTGPLRRQWGGEMVDLITKMWDQDPAQRPAMTDVVAELEQQLASEKAKSKRR
ncbi:hypothetical protein JCM11641_008438 [Rhodosporidiobolus odoratus]